MDRVIRGEHHWEGTISAANTKAMLRSTLRRAIGRGAAAPGPGLRLAPRWGELGLSHGLSTAAAKRSLTLEEAMTSSHMILQTLQSPTTVAQVGKAAWLGLGLLG